MPLGAACFCPPLLAAVCASPLFPPFFRGTSGLLWHKECRRPGLVLDVNFGVTEEVEGIFHDTLSNTRKALSNVAPRISQSADRRHCDHVFAVLTAPSMGRPAMDSFDFSITSCTPTRLNEPHHVSRGGVQRERERRVARAAAGRGSRRSAGAGAL